MERARWWNRMPRLRVTLVRPGQETNPLAEQIMEALHKAIDGWQTANERLRTANESSQAALALIAKLQTQLDQARDELLAYFVCSLDREQQIWDLEQMWTREAPRKDV